MQTLFVVFFHKNSLQGLTSKLTLCTKLTQKKADFVSQLSLMSHFGADSVLVRLIPVVTMTRIGY